MESKHPLQSITIWGGLLALIPSVVSALDQVANSGVVPQEYAVIITGVGGILALVGRKLAKKEIKF